jgi:hypothetical protein
LQRDKCKNMEQQPSEKGTGLRYNHNKLRYDLIHPVGNRGLARVLSKGAMKYALRNWEKGMQWSNVIASAKRHLAALEAGEDYDYDLNCPDCLKSRPGGPLHEWVCRNHTGELHADLLQTNAHFLSTYYEIYPEGDDRPHGWDHQNKWGLDIDEVLCDWLGGFKEAYGYEPGDTHSWNFTYNIGKNYLEMGEEERKAFYLGLKPKVDPKELPFEPHCYITARTVDTKITEQWLEQNGFPTCKVITVPKGSSKVEAAKEAGINRFVDDRYEYFAELNRAGIVCYLMDTPHNRRYEVGHRRIYSLKDLK